MNKSEKSINFNNSSKIELNDSLSFHDSIYFLIINGTVFKKQKEIKLATYFGNQLLYTMTLNEERKEIPFRTIFSGGYITVDEEHYVDLNFIVNWSEKTLRVSGDYCVNYLLIPRQPDCWWIDRALLSQW
jgi:hypothetical protein